MPNQLSAKCRPVLLAACMLGLTAAGPAALAQTQTTHAKAPVHRIRGVRNGVVVRARPRRPAPITPNPDKQAGFDDEATKQAAWTKYRSNTPSLGEKTLDQANSYPGLHTLLPPN